MSSLSPGSGLLLAVTAQSRRKLAIDYGPATWRIDHIISVRRFHETALKTFSVAVAVAAAAIVGSAPALAQTAGKKPNILVIMADDIGWSNIGAYHQGVMYDTTPNLDKLAKEGMRFADYYAEASCTARAGRSVRHRPTLP